MIWLFRWLSFAPLWLMHAIGGFAGRAVLLGSARYRAKLRSNLHSVFGQAEAGRLEASVAAEAGKAVFEMPLMWSASPQRVISHVREVCGWEVVEAAQARGAGLMFLTPHLGCFEITAQFIATRVPITVLYRVPRQGWLDRLMRQGRSRPGMISWPADLSGVRALMKALRRKEAVGLLPDQTPQAGEGVWVPFFGRPAYTMTLAARLAEGAAQVVFVWGERLAGGRGYRLHFSAPEQTLSADLVERTAQLNREVETLIRQCPTQYLWGYNRFKQPPGAPPPPEAAVAAGNDRT